MGKFDNLPDGDELLDALDNGEYIEEALELEKRAMEGMDDFPVDLEDEQRRFRAIFEELRDRGLLTEEEEQQVFGDSGYLDLGYGVDQTAASNETQEIENSIDNKDTTTDNRHKNTGKITNIKDLQKEPGQQTPPQRTRWQKVSRHIGKCAAVAFIACGSLFALSMTSEANRQYVMDTVSYVSGKDVQVKINNDSNIIRNSSEAEMRIDIENKLDVSVPIFKYKPNNMKFVGYEIYEDYQNAYIYYEMEDEKITLYISTVESQKSGIEGFESAPMDVVETESGTNKIDIYENNDGENDQYTYCGLWTNKNARYRLGGIRDKEDFYKILKKMIL